MRTTFLLLAALYSYSLVMAQSYTLNSPDKNLTITFNLMDGVPHYSLKAQGENHILESKLGLKLDQPYSELFKVLDSKTETVDESYEMTWWKNKQVRNHYNEITIMLEDNAQKSRKLDIIFRAYNDGIAIRYSFPKQKNLIEFTIEEDYTEFVFADDYTWWSANGESDNLGPISINGIAARMYETEPALHLQGCFLSRSTTLLLTALTTQE